MTLLLALVLAAPSSQPVERWQRPWVLVKGVVEIPYGAGAGVEIFASDTLSVGTDVNFSPAGTFVRASLHYWPVLRTGRRAHQFLLGAGGDLSATFGAFAGRVAFVIVPASVDLRYLARPLEAFGFVAGLRVGVGFGLQQAVPSHFALSVVTYVGFAFGKRN